MANFETMIPFILHCEEGIPISKLGLPPQQIYALAIARGVHNDPADSGGDTACGVILSTYATYRKKHGYPITTRADLARMKYAEWCDILKTMFWDRWKADQIKTQMVAVACVDWVWGSGVKGIKKVQQLLGVTADGIVGPKTLAALNDYPDQHQLFDKIQAARNAFHASIARPGTKNAKFLRGWNRRVAMITWQGFNYNAKG